MKKPMVSIVIPVYNGANYMREAIDSALAQTYENVEVIVVNDGSDDNGETESIARSYGSKIRYFSKENGGVATALNLAIKEMNGEYFSWLSHDDLYYPNKLMVQMEALSAAGDMQAIVYSDCDYLDSGTGVKTRGALQEQYTLEQLTNSMFVVIHDCAYGCSLLIHKSHFNRVGLFDETLRATQDNDMWFRMFRDQKLIYVSTALACRRMHPQQGIKTISGAHAEGGRFLFKAAKELSTGEIIDAFGHPSIFYHYIAGGVRARAALDLYDELMDLYQASCIREDIQFEQEPFASWFNQLREGCSQICIFGTGISGKQLHFDLSGRGIEVNCFSTNTARRWDTRVEGCRCISPNQLKEISEDTLIVVAVQEANTILEQLKCMGCPHVVTKQMLDGHISRTMPTRIGEHTLKHT